MKGLVPLLEAVAKLRTERDVKLTVIGRPHEGGRVDKAIARLGLSDVVHCVSGISDDAAGPPVRARPRSPSCPRCTRGSPCRPSRRWPAAWPWWPPRAARCPRSWAPTGRPGLLVAPDDPGALAGAIARLLDDPALRARLGAAGRERVINRFTWQVTAAGTAACYEALLAGEPLPGRRPGAAGAAVGCAARRRRMLTVDYDKLGVRPGDRVLDLGCGFGRHAFEAARRGAAVVALDAGPEEVAQVRGTVGAMVEAGELAPDHPATAVQGDALALPFPDATFDRVIASEVLEHIPDDVAAMRELARVLRPGGTMAVTVPRCGPEAINWALSDEYHDTPGGHVRIYRRSTLERRLSSTGLRAHGVPPCPRAALARTGGCGAWSARQRHQPGRGGVPQGAGVGHRQGPLRDQGGRPGAQPAHRQEPGALPDQAAERRGRRARDQAECAPRVSRVARGLDPNHGAAA